MEGSLDTNVLLRWLLGDVPEQQESATRLIEGVGTRINVADLVFVELCFVLDRYYGLNRGRIVRAFETIAAIPAINCNRQLLKEALPPFLAHPSLSFEDCCLAAYAALNDAKPLWTFDKAFAGKLPEARLIETEG